MSDKAVVVWLWSTTLYGRRAGPGLRRAACRDDLPVVADHRVESIRPNFRHTHPQEGVNMGNAAAIQIVMWVIIFGTLNSAIWQR